MESKDSLVILTSRIPVHIRILGCNGALYRVVRGVRGHEFETISTRSIGKVSKHVHHRIVDDISVEGCSPKCRQESSDGYASCQERASVHTWKPRVARFCQSVS